ncbi:MAG TPA: hypothetical protein VMG34_15940 [Bacteroidota bacterium]|nr:hypothetical protein [Bacteroidota bacterium]
MGRNSIYLAIGFTITCLLSGMNLSRVSVDAFSNAINYEEMSMAHNIVQAGTNFACNQLFLTPNWRDGYTNVPFAGGKFTTSVGFVVRGRDSSWIQIVSTGYYPADRPVDSATIKILLQPSLFSKFAYFSNTDPGTIVWTTGDTVWGPYHTNTKIYTNGNPVFNGKTTTYQGISKSNNSDKPQFNGGYESGVYITMPSDLSSLKGKAQQKISGVTQGFYLNTKRDFYLNFNANGTVTYRADSVAGWTTTTLSAFAGPNQVVVIDGGNLHIKGTLNGQVTVAALSNSTTKGGTVWVDSSVAYNTNPLTVPTSTDLLGVVATNYIEIKDTTYNNTAAGVTIQGALFSMNDGLTAENYDTRKAPSGQTMSIHLLGGVSQQSRQPVGTVGSPGTGFKKSYNYDTRMLVTAPPSFPTTGAYEILEWLE